jgi:hypothetical protein
MLIQWLVCLRWLQSNRKDHIDSLVQKQLSGDRTLADFLSNYFNYILSVQLEDGPQAPSHQNSVDPTIDHDKNFELLLNAYKSAPTS